MPVGSFTFVLHSHLPYCRKAGIWPFGEEWLHEALSETYIPLLNALYDLVGEGVKPYLTLGLTPVLVEQLSDAYLLEKFTKYVETKLENCAEDIKRYSGEDEERAALAHFYQEWYAKILHSFQDRFGGDIVKAFRDLQEGGYIEIITSAATHGYLPLLGRDSSIYFQIKTAVDSYKRHFGRQPRGIWLPECAYRPGYEWVSPVDEEAKPVFRPGIDKFLIENKLEYFIVDTHTLEGGATLGVYAARFPALNRLWKQFDKEYVEIKTKETKTTYRPYLLRYNQDFVSIFGRNERSGLQVWSAEWGYPGDGWYREFHKKDLNTGLQYWRVTSSDADLGSKELYNPQIAMERVEDNSNHFVSLMKELLADYSSKSVEPGIVVAPYDAELYGHWWFEGVEWIKRVLRKMDKDPDIELTTGGRYLDKYPATVVVSLPESSWGKGGYHFIWLNPDNEWIWAYVYRAEERMEGFATKYKDTDDGDLKRVLNQAARELLLMESSDWPFLISTGQARDYSAQRFTEHKDKFEHIVKHIESGDLNENFWRWLGEIEEQDNIFPDIDYRNYRGDEES